MFLSPQEFMPNLDCSDLFEPTNDDCVTRIKDDHFQSYFDYMGNYLEKVGMTVSIHQNLPNLYSGEFHLYDKILPIYQICVFDDGELLNEFTYHQINTTSFFNFNDWINDEIKYYVKSKELCQDFDRKLANKSFKRLTSIKDNKLIWTMVEAKKVKI